MTETPLTSQQEAEAVRNIALRKMEELEDLKEKRRAAKEMLDAELEANLDYAEALAAVKAAKEKLKAAKKKVLAAAVGAQLDKKVKEASSECRSTRKDISVFLIQYNELTGEKVFKTPAGDEIEIIKSAKAKRKKRK